MAKKEAGKKKTSIFRKKTLDRISSPEQLTDYLRVTSPGIWIVLAAIVTLLVGFFVWMGVDTIETTVPVGVSMEDAHATVAVTEGDVKIEKDMTLRVGGKEAAIQSTKTDEYGRTVGLANVDLTDGMYDGVLVTEAVHPIQFLISSK
ncbi:MAG: hypothetical protein UHS51_00475 [Atopobiaceae bacterium]|nr:hypothetical protein [Atopobiaceae bacterium]